MQPKCRTCFAYIHMRSYHLRICNYIYAYMLLIARYMLNSKLTRQLHNYVVGSIASVGTYKLFERQNRVEIPIFCLDLALSLLRTLSLSLCFVVPPAWLYQELGLVNHCFYLVLSCRKWCRQAGVLGNECLWEGRERRETLEKGITHWPNTHVINKSMCSTTWMPAWLIFPDTCFDNMHSQNDTWTRIITFIIMCHNLRRMFWCGLTAQSGVTNIAGLPFCPCY